MPPAPQTNTGKTYTPKEDTQVITGNLHQDLKPSGDKGYVGSPVRTVAEKPKQQGFYIEGEPDLSLTGKTKAEPTKGIEPFTATKGEIVRSSLQRQSDLTKSIDPEGLYYVDYSDTPQTGATIRANITNQERMFRSSIQNYKKGTTFSYDPSTGGYIIKEPDKSLDFTKRELERIDKAYKINPLLGATAEFGFGAVSSVGALVEPVLKWRDPSRDIHAVSPFDYVFEPIGWAPEGSTKILSERPVFTAGGIASEIVLSYGFTKAFEGGATVFRAGTKAAVKAVPNVYGKMTTVFPKAFGKTLVTEGGSKIGGSVLARGSRKIAGTTFSKNIYGWAAKGWKPGRTLVYRSAGEPIKRGGELIQKGKFVVQRSLKNPLGKRIWLTADDIAKYEAKLAGSKFKDIGFTGVKQHGAGQQFIFGTEQIKYKPGLFGSLKKTAKTYTYVDDTARYIHGISDDVSRGLGSHYRGQGAVTPTLDVDTGKSNKWFESVKRMYKYGYTHETPIISSTKKGVTQTIGKRVKHVPGFGSGVSQPLPKRWITKKLELGFIKSQEATAALVSRSKTALKFGSRTMGGRGIITKVPLVARPALTTIPLYATSRAATGYISTKQVIQQTRQAQSPLLNQLQKVKQKPATIQTPIQQKERITLTTPIQRVTVKQRTGLKQRQKQDVVLKQIIKQDVVTKQPTKTTLKTPSFSHITSRPRISVPILPPVPGMYGRGRMGWGEGKRGKKYKFRLFDIGELI